MPTGLFSLTQKSRKVGPRSGPSCREETANAVHHPEREEAFKNGIPMVEGAGFGVLLWGRSRLGSWLVVSVEGGHTGTQGREGFILPLFILGARVYILPRGGEDTPVPTSGCGIRGLVPFPPASTP